MFFLAKQKDENVPTTSAGESSREKPSPLRRQGTFGSADVFRTWARDSFLNDNTIDVLVQTHQIDCLPAVLALQVQDIAELGLAVGQQRLLEEAVQKLHQEYELVRPPTPRTKINLNMPSYKSLIEIEDRSESAEGPGASEVQPSLSPSMESWKSGERPPEETPIRSSDGERCTLLKLESKTTAPLDKNGEGSRKDNSHTGEKCSSKHLVGDEVEGKCVESLCACKRWFLVAILMPLLLIIASLGSLLVLLMMPFRCCCRYGGYYSNVVTFLFECFIMSPCRACQWATGVTDWNIRSDKKPNVSHIKTARYGSTHGAEQGESGK